MTTMQNSRSHRIARRAILAVPVIFLAACSTVVAPVAQVRPATEAAPAAGTTVPGARRCPMFPANNVWNTDISQPPVSKRRAEWLRSMASASTYLHPDFGPDQGGYPYGIPYNVVTNSHPGIRLKFEYATESYRGLYPFGSDTRIEGGKNA